MTWKRFLHLLACCEGNPQDCYRWIPLRRPSVQNFGVFFDISLNWDYYRCIISSEQAIEQTIQLQMFTFETHWRSWNFTVMFINTVISYLPPFLFMMTSWLIKWNTFHVIGPLWRESTGQRWFPSQRPVTRSFDVSFDVRLDKWVNKQWSCQWFETP